MNQQEFICCICKKSFTEVSQPRMMPQCQHSACTSCIKQLISKKKEYITCEHCGHKQNVGEVDLQYFPKNINLTKQLKGKTASINNSSSNNQQSSRDTITSGTLSQTEIQLCPQHKKQMEIICINDRVKLCSHCALFGGHKDHNFKTISEVNQMISLTYELFQSYKCRKLEIDSKINSVQFRQAIVKKISEEKDRLIFQIKKKFGIIIENTKLAEKKAYEDVIKNFKTVYNKILALVKQQNDSQRNFRLWEMKCLQEFKKSQKLKNLQDKAVFYFGGPLKICHDGQHHLKRLENKINNNILTIQSLISQIKIIENPGISNSVFNYINIVLQDSQLDGLGFVNQQIISPRQVKQDFKEQKIQFGPDHLKSQRQSLSPIPRNKSKPKDIQTKSPICQKRSSGKTMVSPQRNSVDRLIQQFCERDNLDTLDLTGYSLNDLEIYEILLYLKPIKRIKGLKLVKNKLTNQGLLKIAEFLSLVTNINLSFNQLGDQSVSILLNNRSRLSNLRIINLSNNKINQRKTKNAIDQLKKQGVIVTL